MADRDNWTAAMVLKWFLIRDLPTVLAMVESYGDKIISEDTLARVVPEDLDAVMRAYCVDPTLPPGEERAREAVLRSHDVIAAKAEIYRALRHGELEAKARRNGSGDVETIAPNQWLALQFQSLRGHDLALPIGIEKDVLNLPHAVEDYLSGRVPIDVRPVVWPDPHIAAAQVEKLWPIGGETRFTAGAEAETTSWLISLMKAGNPSQAKGQYETEARGKFQIGKRAFNRAWADAIKESGNVRWSRPGRKSSR
jgi:hypothetical protein